MGMICTNCYRDTEVEPDFDGLPSELMLEQCRNWLCSDCLDLAEAAHDDDLPPNA